MSDKESIFKKMDKAVFELVDKYKASNTYAQTSEQLSSLSEIQRKIIGQVSNLLLIFLPVVFLVVVFFLNYQKETVLNVKKDIIKTVDKYVYNKNQLEFWGKKIVSSQRFNTQDDLQRRLQQSVNVSAKEHGPTLRVADFNQKALGESYIKTNAFVEFSNLSSRVLSNLLKEIVTVTKCKIISFNLQKDPQNKFIRGSIELEHYGKK